ncbi:addiction module protein [Desulfatiferula olefinivorans]
MDKVLLEKALKMPPNERVIFAELILASIDKEDESLRLEWISEVKSRMEAVRTGKAKLLDFEDVVDER